MNSTFWKRVSKYSLRTLEIIGITLLALVITVYGVGVVITHGPSEKAKKLFVLSMNETSAAKWIPSLFLSDAEIKDILGNRVTAADQGDVEIDTSLINTDKDKEEDKETDKPQYDTEDGFYIPDDSDVFEEAPEYDNVVVADDGITIVEVKGSTYSGEMMIIDDPERVFVATLDSYGESAHGLTLDQFIKKYDAIGGTNAGGFYDPNGEGNGGTPDGLVIGDSKILWGGEDKVHHCVIGFDENNILHVGNFSGKKALEKNLISAVSFAPGPLLVVNGEAMNEDRELGGGLNPRTAIGQRSDGAILLLVVDGRQTHSLGATYDDLVDIMLQFGAVNAANLDGGSSTRMHYNGERINECASMLGQRGLPNAILIKRKEG